jgi:hypothetical protein
LKAICQSVERHIRQKTADMERSNEPQNRKVWRMECRRAAAGAGFDSARCRAAQPQGTGLIELGNAR